jgi:uncharacterized metal-binding protein
MSAKNCMCQEAGLLVFPCSGGSDVGELSDRIGRTIANCGQAKMYCLAGIGAHIPGMIESARAAKKIISIDGCPVLCAKKTLEHAGFKVESYNLKNFGFEKGKTKVDEDSVKSAVSRITGGKIEETISRTSGDCCSR